MVVQRRALVLKHEPQLLYAVGNNVKEIEEPGGRVARARGEVRSE